MLSASELWDSIKCLLFSLMEKYVPTKTIKGDKNHKPWITRDVRTIRHKERHLYKKARNSSSQRDLHKYKKIKARAQKLQRQAYWTYVNTIIDSTDDTEKPSSQKRFWRYIKSLRKDNTGVAPLKENGRLYTEPKAKANILNRQYQSVFTREDVTSVPTPDGTPFPDMPTISISIKGVEALLKKINPQKAAGPDGIPAKILKECAEELAPILTILFTKTLEEGTLPEDWKEANITAVFKKGDRNIAANYRPVSLTSICCKLQEHVIVSSVMKHLESHNILTDCQHGFRAR